MQLYCLDNSDAACRSEDYPCGNRLAWQLSVIRTVSRSLLAPQQAQDKEDTSLDSTSFSLAVICSAGRPSLAVAPTTDAAALLGLDVACHDGERCQLLGALRLALLASKRSSSARVLAFVASQADLPADQCRQLSRSFADARVPLDVVLLSPEGELPADQLTPLELLTAVTSYADLPEPAPAAAATTSTGGAAAQRRGSQRASGTSSSIIRPSNLSPSSSSSWPSTSHSTTAVPGAEGGRHVGCGGQRLLRYSPPDPSLALWQQLEPLLEMLQLEGAAAGAGAGQAPAETEHGEAGSEDDRAAPSSSQRRTSNPSASTSATASTSTSTSANPSSGRPPLPRPPRQRGTTGSSSSILPQLRAGLAPSGPLASRSGARGGVSSGTCRYESLDSLQHLSLDGFLRSWLPSYANYSRVLPVNPQHQQQSQGSGSGATGSGSAQASSSSSSGGPGRLCYISVYRLQLPQWHKLLEVHAGCMYERDAPEGAQGPQSPAVTAGAPEAAAGGSAQLQEEVAVAARQQPADKATDGPSGSPLSPRAATMPPMLRPTVVVPRAPCPVQVTFSSRCSSAAAAASSSSSGDSASSSGLWVCPDPRRGCLSLIASVEDPGVVKLLWSERQRPSAAQQQQQQQYGSIFQSAAEEAADGGVDPSSAELELTLSPTRSQFRVVPHVSGGAVLEVLSPRSAVHRPREAPSAAPSAAGTATTGGEEGALSSPPSAPPSASGPSSASPRAADNATRGKDPSSTLSAPAPHPPYAYPYQPNKQRYFFWLQQAWRPSSVATMTGEDTASGKGAAKDVATEEEGARSTGSESESGPELERGTKAAVSSGLTVASEGRRKGTAAAPSERGCRGLAEQLQALLECPPEFDPHKQGNKVRCNSTPLQLGPLPFALVEEIMRASGRELNPDGTVTTHTLSAPSSSSSPSSSSYFSRDVHTAPKHDLPRHHHHHHHHGCAKAPGKAEQPTAVRRVERFESLGLSGTGSGGSAATAASSMGKLHHGAPRSAPAAATAAAAAVAGKVASAPVPMAASAAAATGPMQPPDASQARQAERKEVVRGFVRTTYSRGAAPPPPPRVPARDSGIEGGGGDDRRMVAVAGSAAVMAAAAALASHPLEVSDWGSDCESQDEAEGSASISKPDCYHPHGEADYCGAGAGEAAAAAAAGVDPEFPRSATSTAHTDAIAIDEHSPPGPACLRAAAAAAAAAAAGTSGASLVTGVDSDAGGSCQQEEPSLLYELD